MQGTTYNRVLLLRRQWYDCFSSDLSRWSLTLFNLIGPVFFAVRVTFLLEMADVSVKR